MDKRWRTYIAETVGTFLIVFLGGAAVCAAMLNIESQDVNLWIVAGIALGEGAALAVVLPIVFRESPGCLNPAVTLALWVCKRLETREMAILVAVQLLGAVLAGLALRTLFPEHAYFHATPHLQAPLLDAGQVISIKSELLGVLTEALLTFVMTFAVFGLMIDRRAPRFGGVAVGLARAAVVLAGFQLTGAAANPARWFGPYVWQFTVKQLQNQSPYLDNPPYWVGPVLGGLAAGMLYTTFILPPDQAKETVE
jgi:glycerol uptake facilitator-like aquaporin